MTVTQRTWRKTLKKMRRMTRRKKTCGLEPNDQGRVEGGGGGERGGGGGGGGEEGGEGGEREKTGIYNYNVHEIMFVLHAYKHV